MNLIRVYHTFNRYIFISSWSRQRYLRWLLLKLIRWHDLQGDWLIRQFNLDMRFLRFKRMFAALQTLFFLKILILILGKLVL